MDNTQEHYRYGGESIYLPVTTTPVIDRLTAEESAIVLALREQVSQLHEEIDDLEEEHYRETSKLEQRITDLEFALEGDSA